MAAMPLERDSIVECLRGAMRDGAMGLGQVPALLKRVLVDDCWRSRVVKRTGEVVEFDRFDRFVVTAPLEGLGTTLETFRNLIKHDVEALDLYDRAVKESERQGERTDLHDIIREVQQATLDYGTSEQYALRKLRDDAPTLHASVIKGELSPHAAMVQAGFRKPTATVPTHDPEAAARRLARHFAGDRLDALIAALEVHRAAHAV